MKGEVPSSRQILPVPAPLAQLRKDDLMYSASVTQPLSWSLLSYFFSFYQLTSSILLVLIPE